VALMMASVNGMTILFWGYTGATLGLHICTIYSASWEVA
jgi:hypothetical protein